MIRGADGNLTGAIRLFLRVGAAKDKKDRRPLGIRLVRKDRSGCSCELNGVHLEVLVHLVAD